MIRILIADDHAVVRAGYRQFLQALQESVELSEARTAAEVLEGLAARKCDLLLLDLHLPDRSGLEILEVVRAQYPATKVLMVSALPEEQYAPEVLRAGGAGYISKHTVASELLSAVRRVLGGQRYLSARVAESLVEDLGRPTGPRHQLLSAREMQVFLRLASGAMITQIAGELELSIKTVSTYRSRILEKLRMKSNADMTSYSIRHGLSERVAEAKAGAGPAIAASV